MLSGYVSSGFGNGGRHMFNDNQVEALLIWLTAPEEAYKLGQDRNQR